MTESSRRGGGKGKSVVPPTRNVSPLNIQDLDFLFDDDCENPKIQLQKKKGSTRVNVKRRVLDCCDWMLRLGDQLWIEEPVEGATRRRLDKSKRYVSRIASGTSCEESASFWFSLRLGYLAPCDWPLMADARLPLLATYRYPIEIAGILRRAQRLLLSDFSRAIVRSSAEVVFQILCYQAMLCYAMLCSVMLCFALIMLCSVLLKEMAPSVPRTHAAAALRMKQIALDNQDRRIRRLRAQLASERRGLAATKKELKETQVALEASHKVITGLTEIGLSMSKKIEKMKLKKQLVKANHVECHQKFQARIHEDEDSMQAQHLLIEALVDEKDSLLQTIHDLQEANNAPAPFEGDWEEEPEEEPEEIEDIPLGEGEIDDE
ncbi:hypothetical protein F511_12602 [Dorcoceras hygrometricum]|uniref:Uncharacterized protein n=1 Tax=Dorcoceras hygrometricum TaxID=472368 RepID=A0A2Z7C3U0_9LAMI|nr:hypothetical protein F511_12602 [Dorcoceras hygrometricum]